MISITLPDGNKKSFDHPVSVQQVAESIGAGLAKAALAGRVDDVFVDLSHIINKDASVSIITEKSAEALEIVRHSCAHLLAQAVKQLFPTAQVTIGPVIEDGFYYDFAFGRSFTEEDLALIEKQMLEIASQDIPVVRRTLSRNDAIKCFHDQGEHYKVKIIQDIAEDQVLSLYRQGDFEDLCRGPHLPNVNRIKAFKLTKVAGAYWRGDSNNEMLQRIYGTAWLNKKDLDAYLLRIEEAQKRDHRQIAKDQDLFHIQAEAPGMVFWHPNGAIVYHILEQYLRDRLKQGEYKEVRTPLMADQLLWQKSGHLENYREHMFMTESENRVFAVKPMSCPMHVEIFKQGLKSHKELPIRFAEFGCCHRNELSGALHGLMRVRNFVQDDGHIFCREDQVQAESLAFIKTLQSVYHDFGFDEISVRLSTRPEKRLGSDESWDRAEAALANALTDAGLSYIVQKGEGAFYGPKIEFHIKDCMGRMWQLGTLQLDPNLPERLGAEYVAEDSSRQVPIMLHRAIIGTFERFLGILIEHYAGIWPVWLAPCQVAVMSITDEHHEFSQFIGAELKNNGFRVDIDLRNEKIGYKIRQQSLMRVPYQLVIGDRECESKTVSVRTLKGRDLGSMTLTEFMARLSQDCKALGRVTSEKMGD